MFKIYKIGNPILIDKGPIDENIYFGLKKYKFGWLRT